VKPKKLLSIAFVVLLVAAFFMPIVIVTTPTSTTTLTLNSENFADVEPTDSAGTVSYANNHINLAVWSDAPGNWSGKGVVYRTSLSVDEQIIHIETSLDMAAGSRLCNIALNKNYFNDRLGGDVNPSIKLWLQVQNTSTDIEATAIVFANISSNCGEESWLFDISTESVNFDVKITSSSVNTAFMVNDTLIGDVRTYDILDSENYLFLEAATNGGDHESVFFDYINVSVLTEPDVLESPFAVVKTDKRLFGETNYADDPSIIFDNGYWYMLTSGIRLFKSSNLYDWSMVWAANKVFGGDGDTGASKPCLIQNGGTSYIFYTLVNATTSPATIDAIHLATSTDLENSGALTYQGAVLNATSTYVVLQAPEVIEKDGTWYMFFYYQDSDETNSLMGLATSSSLTSGWTFSESNPIMEPEGIEAHLVSPTVFLYAETYYMLYNIFDAKSTIYTGEYGHGLLCLATSSNLLTWTRSSLNPFVIPSNYGEWPDSDIYTGDVVFSNGIMYYFYNYQHNDITEYTTVSVNFDPEFSYRLYNLTNCNVTSATATAIDIFTFNVTAPISETSTTEVYTGDSGSPISVYGASTWSYDSGTSVVSITVSHEDSEEKQITLSWALLPEVTVVSSPEINSNFTINGTAYSTPQAFYVELSKPTS
jgi:hypothetical protein